MTIGLVCQGSTCPVVPVEIADWELGDFEFPL